MKHFLLFINVCLFPFFLSLTKTTNESFLDYFSYINSLLYLNDFKTKLCICNNQWTNISHSMSFQLENNCDWENFKDRSFSSCPFLSISGCKFIVKECMYSRFIEIFNTMGMKKEAIDKKVDVLKLRKELDRKIKSYCFFWTIKSC